MRFVFVVILTLVLLACEKQRLVNALEGSWTYTKLLQKDGSYVYFTDTYVFEGGEADGKSFLPLTISGSDTIQASYCVKKKVAEMQITYKVSSGDSLVNYNIEDWDKNSFIIRGLEGAMFFDKQ